ncbi:hypothetical protein F4782DRAFT_136755 [Xylaria castorea]|nr:hypothetical protein F4782DRAFT_136755 [Xylaria castorea]
MKSNRGHLGVRRLRNKTNPGGTLLHFGHISFLLGFTSSASSLHFFMFYMVFLNISAYFCFVSAPEVFGATRLGSFLDLCLWSWTKSQVSKRMFILGLSGWVYNNYDDDGTVNTNSISWMRMFEYCFSWPVSNLIRSVLLSTALYTSTLVLLSHEREIVLPACRLIILLTAILETVQITVLVSGKHCLTHVG